MKHQHGLTTALTCWVNCCYLDVEKWDLRCDRILYTLVSLCCFGSSMGWNSGEWRGHEQTVGRALVLWNSSLSRGMVGPESGAGFLLDLSKQQQLS